MFSFKNSVLRPRVSSSLLALIFCAAILAGCGGPPSEANARLCLERRIQKESGGNIKLVSFSKTDAEQRENRYGVEYEAEIEFVADGSWTSGDDSSSPFFGFSIDTTPAPGLSTFFSAIGRKAVQKGSRTTVKGVLIFHKTENGWRADDGETY